MKGDYREMKKLIYAAMNEDTLSYKEKDEIAQSIFKLVQQFFYNEGHGRPSPRVTYSKYDMLEYTFRVNSQTRNQDVCYLASPDQTDFNQFRKAVRAELKGWGFYKVKFDIRTVKINYGTEINTRKELVAIYFAEG